MKVLKRKKLAKRPLNPSVAELKEARASRKAVRVAIAEGFRSRLVAQLQAARGGPRGVPLELSASEDALLTSAVSAFVEIDRTTSRFLAGYARPHEMKRLGFARSELRRCLVSLHLVASDGGEGRDDASGETSLADIQREYAAAGAAK